METHSFTAPVRGFHYYRRFWRPKEDEKLDCLHEPGNAFDRFAIKTVNEKGEIVGHLPKEISRVTKYLLDRGFTIYCKLSSRHYRRSPLVQGGLEIQCEVVLISRATMLQSRLTARYMGLVTDLYTEPAEDRAVGNLFNFVMTLPPVANTPPVSVQNRKKRKLRQVLEEIKILEKCLAWQKERNRQKLLQWIDRLKKEKDCKCINNIHPCVFDFFDNNEFQGGALNLLGKKFFFA